MRAKWLLLGSVVVLVAHVSAVAVSAEETESIVELENIDACFAVQTLMGRADAVPEPYEFLQSFAARMFDSSCRRSGYDVPMRMDAASGAIYREDIDAMDAGFAEKVTVEPMVLDCENAVKITGPTEAVAAVESRIGDLDVARHDIVLEVRWVDWSDETVEMLDLAWTEVSPCPGAWTDHPSPALKYAFDPIGASVGMADNPPDRWFTKCAEFYMDDGVQSIFAMGEVAKFCCRMTDADSWAWQPIDYRKLNCFFFGVEMWVRPSITEDGAVMLRLRPRTGEAAAALRQGPDTGLRWEQCGSRPLVRHQAQGLAVKVDDGSSLVLRGLVRGDFPVKAEVFGPDRPEYISEHLSRQPTMIITPRIISG